MKKTIQKIFEDAETRKAVGFAQTVTIELRPDDRRSDPMREKSYKLNPGGFDVFVNGTHWGRTSPEPKGVHGALHFVCQMTLAGGCHRASIEVPRQINPRFGHPTRRKEFCEWSDKHYLRNRGMIPAPMQDRLIAKIAEAIREHALRDPVAINREAKAAAEHAREIEATRKQEEQAEWLKRAKEAIGPYGYGMAPGVVADLTARIVDAMKWAQLK